MENLLHRLGRPPKSSIYMERRRELRHPGVE